MEILKCTTQHQIEELAQLAKQIWHEYFIHIISHEQIDYMVEKYQSLTALKKSQSNKKAILIFLPTKKDS